MNIKPKLFLLAIGPLLVVSVAVVAISFYEKEQVNNLVTKEVEALVQVDAS